MGVVGLYGARAGVFHKSRIWLEKARMSQKRVFLVTGLISVVGLGDLGEGGARVVD